MRLTTGAAALALFVVAAADSPAVRVELEPLAFVVGSCWAGRFDDQGRVDTHCFSSVFGGMHIRDTHTLTDGKSTYEGETMFSWDATNSEIRFVYWNSLGGVSFGRAVPEDGRIVFPDEQYEGPDGEKVSVETWWQPEGSDAYDSYVVERFGDGSRKERRVRYVRQ